MTHDAPAATARTAQFQDALSNVSGESVAEESSGGGTSWGDTYAAYAGGSDDGATGGTTNTFGAPACDDALRKCMAEKCGADFTKCANDSTTIWGNKIQTCRAQTKCTTHEYELLAPEILADRDVNVQASFYDDIITCGKTYNRCIFKACGESLENCLAKSDGDRAISECAKTATQCKEQDSGLAGRAMTAFGDLRTIKTESVKRDEAKLYELRTKMRDTCNGLGAMFDERTLNCVFTVNFFAGDDTATPKASKKLYAGETFTCDADWFGVDVTTFKENAYRYASAQASASAAVFGAGVGTAAGFFASGAFDRAHDTRKAEQAKCEAEGREWKFGRCQDKVEETGGGTEEQPAG